MKLDIIIRLITYIIKNMSGELRTVIVKAVLEWEKIAEGTPNQIDNVLILLLKVILEIPNAEE